MLLFFACFCSSQRVQRRKAELTLAQIREKLPNGSADWHKIWHTCAHLYWNGYTPNKWSLEKKGASWGVLGGQHFKSLGKLSDWHQLWFTSADSSGNGHRLNTSRPSIPQVVFRGGGGLGCHKFKKSGEAVKRLDRLAPKLAHICRSIWEWIYAKQIALETQGALWGVRGETLKQSWEAVKRLDRLAPKLAHICRSIWEWIYAKQIALETQGALWGVRGETLKQSWEAVKRLDRLAPTVVHVCGFIWEWTQAKSKSPLNTPRGIGGGG